MKKIIIFAALVTATSLTLPTALSAQDETSGTLVINVAGVRNDEGHVMMVLKKSPDMASTDYICPSMTEASSEGVQFTATGLTVGEKMYIFIFHDENGNNIMDFDKNYKPLEGFVTAPGEMVPSAEIHKGETEVTVQMTYLN